MIDPKQLKMGEKVEKEHHKGPAETKQIAIDHLKEIPDYYTRLEKMEKEAPINFNSDKENEMNKNPILASIKKNNKKKGVAEEEKEEEAKEPQAEERTEKPAEEKAEEKSEKEPGGKEPGTDEKEGKKKMIMALIALKKKK
jgi:hypothetical protein